MECAECEMNVLAGHAPDCSRRCQSMHSTGDELVQCERRVQHDGEHGVYGPEDEDGMVETWPAILAAPAVPTEGFEVMLGRDVDIDGNVWPGSPYEAYLRAHPVLNNPEEDKR